MSNTAIVTSCDERYAPLAKGLILSLRSHGFPVEGQEICLLDIGCSQETVNWMQQQGVRVTRFVGAEHIPFPTEHLPKHIAAMAFRPFMRSVFPGYEIYMWIDSDTWVQQAASVHLYHALAAEDPNCIVISPLIDLTYRLHYEADAFTEQLKRVYESIYGEAGSNLSRRPPLGAGVFAMHRNSPVWEKWANQLPIVYRRNYESVPEGLHLAEQTALNRVLYSVCKPRLVESIHNFHMCAGPSGWFDGQLCSMTATWIDGRVARKPIGIAHLCGMGSYAEKYVEARAFFDRGNYLTQQELQSIAALRRGSKKA